MSDALRDAIVAAVRQVKDPEIPVNLFDLGLIRDIAIDANGSVHISMTLTTPNCPVAELLPEQVRVAAASVDDVGEVTVELSWDPAWSPADLTARGRAEMELMGLDIEHMIAKHDSGLTDLTVRKTSK